MESLPVAETSTNWLLVNAPPSGLMRGTWGILKIKVTETTAEEAPSLKARTDSFSLADKARADVYLVQGTVAVSVVVWTESAPVAETVTFCEL